MKLRKVIVPGALITLAAAYTISIVPSLRHRAEYKSTVDALKSLPYERIHAATEAFKCDQDTTDSVVPLEVLIAGGYLLADDVPALIERDVSVSPGIDETTPQTVWICVRATDGSDIVLMADGSVQKVIRQ